ncbi:MAG: thiamine pyrophosphate-dependent enzyme, partial [Nocardioidaceae bacterium]
DFTTASRTVFAADGVRFVNLNVAPSDAHKLSATALTADARSGLEALAGALDGWHADEAYTARATDLARDWDEVVQAAYDGPARGDSGDGTEGTLPTQAQVIGAVNELSAPGDVVVCAAGSMPGDLHKLWRTRDRKGYHVEYGYSCMGYEIAGGLGVGLAVRDAGEDREVFVLVGDGSYLMMSSELVTAVQEGVKIIVVLVQNHGFASIGALSESVGSQRFGTRYRYRTESGLDGGTLPVDLAANAASLGVDVLPVHGVDELRGALRKATRSTRSTLVHVETDPMADAPDSPAWWDVPVPEVSSLDSTRDARAAYDRHKADQRSHLDPSDPLPSDPRGGLPADPPR